MTELELRQKLVNTAISYLGYKESNGTHRKIIDLYNSHKPLANGYRVTYQDDWCATFASAMAIACELTDIIPTECGCQRQIALFKQIGAWEENDAHVPSPGDLIYYDWQDNGKGDNQGWADHVGIVVSVTGNAIKLIEGNIKDSVGYRTLYVDAKNIRGYGVPDYAAKASRVGTPSRPSTSIDVSVGDVVDFIGTKHHISSTSINHRTCKPGKALVTAIARTGKHPVHLIAQKGGGSNVYGWVDAVDVVRESATLAVGARVRVKAGASSYTGGSLASYVYKAIYDVIQIDGDRVVIGLGKAVTAAIHADNLTVL